MRNLQIYFLFFIGILVVCSCSKKSNSSNSVRIPLSRIETQIPMSHFIDDISTIKLELPMPYFFGVITDVLFADSTLFVVDKKQGNIFHFKNDGTFLDKIGGKGEAPGEFLNLHRFFIGDKYLFVSDINVRKIHCYTHSGDYVKSVTSAFELVYDDIVALPHGKFLCHDIQGYKGDSKIWIMNDKGEKESTLLFHKDDYPYSYTDWNTITVTRDNKISILDPITGTFYLYSSEENELTESLRLVTEEKDLSAFGGVENFSVIRDKYAYLSFAIDADNFLYSLWTTSDDIAMFSLYEKHNKKIDVFRMPQMDFPGYSICPIPASTNLPNAMIAIMTDEYPLDCFPEQYQDGITEQVAVVYVMKFR